MTAGDDGKPDRLVDDVVTDLLVLAGIRRTSGATDRADEIEARARALAGTEHNSDSAER